MKKLMLMMFIGMSIFILSACGGGNDQTGGESNSTGNSLDIVASNWDFDEGTYTVPAGDITFNLINNEGYHGIVIEGADVKIEGEGSATATLAAGEYTIKCTIPCGEGHDEMTATLVVE